MILFVVGLAVLLIVVSVGVIYYGVKMPEGKQVSNGFGTSYDSTAFVFRGAMIFVGGIVLLIIGLTFNVPSNDLLLSHLFFSACASAC